MEEPVTSKTSKSNAAPSVFWDAFLVCVVLFIVLAGAFVGFGLVTLAWWLWQTDRSGAQLMPWGIVWACAAALVTATITIALIMRRLLQQVLAV